MKNPESDGNTVEMVPFTEAEVQWTPSDAGPAVLTDAAVASSLASWSKKLELNISTRARVPKLAQKQHLGRCRPAVFREKQLFKKTQDPVGAAQSKWSRVWANINSRRVEWKALVCKPHSLGRKKHPQDCQRYANKLSKQLHELNSARGQSEGIHVKYAAWL